jgi:hypothetical protein
VGKERLVVFEPDEGEVGYEAPPVAKRYIACEADKGIDKNCGSND